MVVLPSTTFIEKNIRAPLTSYLLKTYINVSLFFICKLEKKYILII